MANDTEDEVTLVSPEARLRLTVPEIKRRYPDRWVVVVDEECQDMQLVAGVVYAHSSNRRALSPTIKTLPMRAVFWTGQRQGSIAYWWFQYGNHPV